MKRRNLYRGRHFSPEIISYAVWLYARFTLSFRDVEEVLALHGLVRSLVNWGRHRLSATAYRYFRTNAFASWLQATCA